MIAHNGCQRAYNTWDSSTGNAESAKIDGTGKMTRTNLQPVSSISNQTNPKTPSYGPMVLWSSIPRFLLHRMPAGRQPLAIPSIHSPIPVWNLTEMAMGQKTNRTPNEHPNPHQNRLKRGVRLPQNGTIGFDPQPNGSNVGKQQGDKILWGDMVTRGLDKSHPNLCLLCEHHGVLKVKLARICGVGGISRLSMTPIEWNFWGSPNRKTT